MHFFLGTIRVNILASLRSWAFSSRKPWKQSFLAMNLFTDSSNLYGPTLLTENSENRKYYKYLYIILCTEMRTVSNSQSGKYVGWLQNAEKQFFNHLLKVKNHKISIETSQFMRNLYPKLSFTSFKNKFQQKQLAFYKSYARYQEILINPELSHACL